MGFFRNIWDGLLSLGAFALTIAVFGIPIWAAHLAIGARLVPVWSYAALAGLVYVGGNLAIAFLRKALKGVSPLRDRKRR